MKGLPMTHSGLRGASYRGAVLLGMAALGAGPLGLTHPLAAQQAAAAAAFRGVTVIDVTTGRRRPNQIVVVVGNRVRAVGPAATVRAPKGARVIEAQGKYLIPGL